MSAPPGYEPIQPGSSKTERALKWLSPLVWVLVVYFGLAWWRGEPPKWNTVFNILSISAALFALAGWRSTSERRSRRRLRRLFEGGEVPDLTDVTPLLEGIEEDLVHQLTERYALGMMTPQEYSRDMAMLLGADRTTGGVRSAVS